MSGRAKASAILAALLAAIIVAGCAQTAAESGSSSSAAAETVTSASGAVSAVETTAQPDSQKSESAASTAALDDATQIALRGSTAEISGKGAAVSAGTVTITAGGTYVLRGEFTGSIVVSAPSADTVRLVLDGAHIQADKNAAIYCTQADELVIELAEGSENTVADAADFAYADTAAEEPDAAIFSKNDLTISGSGSLTVNAGFHNGIGTKDDLVISGGSFQIIAANHGIRGRDSTTITDGTFTIQAGADGIQANNDEDAAKGWISLEGGSYNITAGNDAVQAETSLTVSGGVYQLATGGGSGTTPADTTGSYKGLKAKTDLTISGGTFVIDSADDTVHANGNIAISGGDLTLSSGDDGVHADGDLTITGADTGIEITTSNEGLEAKTMTIADGKISLYATDDGINIAGGNDSSGGGRFGQDGFQAGSSDQWLKITGGAVVVNADGDGIDVNGSAEISGGTVYVSGPTSGGNGALDCDGSFNITGGTLIAAGSAGMAQSPSGTSTQPSLLLYYSAQQAPGTAVELRSADGDTLASFSPEKGFQTVVISAPGMQAGSTYTVYTNDAKTLDIALSGAVTSVSDTGEAVTGGGMGGPGGMRGGGMGDPGGMRGERGQGPKADSENEPAQNS